MVENVAKKEVFEAAMQHACSLSSIRRQCVPVPEGTRKYYKVPEGIGKVSERYQKVPERYQWCQRPQCWCNAHIPQCQKAVCMSSVRRRSLFVKRVRTTRGLCRLSQSAASCCWSFQSTITSQKSTCILLCYVSRILYLSYI